MVQIFFFLVLSLISLVSFGVSFKTVSANELDSRKLVGMWTSGNSQVNIYCSGAMDYNMEGPLSAYFDSQTSCDGCSVHKIKGDHLVLGPFKLKKLKISKWPYDEGGQMKMVVENTIFTRSSYKGPCTSKR